MDIQYRHQVYLQQVARQKQDQAMFRVSMMEFNETEEAFIWAYRPNWDRHINWLLTASRAEIKAWIDANY